MMDKVSELLDARSLSMKECQDHSVSVAWVEIDIETHPHRELGEYFLDHLKTVCSHLFAPRIAIRNNKFYVVGYRFNASENAPEKEPVT